MKNMTKIFASATCVSAFLMFAMPAVNIQAKSTTTVTYQIGNNQVTDYKGVHELNTAPYLFEGNTMIPIRSLAEGLQMPISWDENKKEVTLQLNNRSYSITLNDDRLWTDGKSFIEMPIKATYINGNTFVPIRAVAEVLDSKLDWQSDSNTVIVSHPVSDEKVDLHLRYSFDNSDEGWIGDFADLPSEGDTSIYELERKRELIPLAGNSTNYGYKLSGMNRSDDLLMFLKKKVTGLQSNTTYKVSMSFNLYTDVSGGNIGVGGAPAEAVHVKAGVVNIEPKTIIIDDYYRMNIDVGSQRESGKDMQRIGDITKPNAELEGYQVKPFTYETEVTTDKDGSTFLIIGTDSGFEGLSTIYYDDIEVKFNMINQ